MDLLQHLRLIDGKQAKEQLNVEETPDLSRNRGHKSLAVIIIINKVMMGAAAEWVDLGRLSLHFLFLGSTQPTYWCPAHFLSKPLLAPFLMSPCPTPESIWMAKS